MKRTLLSLAAVCALGVSAQETKTVAFYAGTAPDADQTVQLSGTVAGQTFTSDYADIEFIKVNSSSSNVNGDLVRWYQGDKIKISGVDDAKITELKLIAGGTSYALPINNEAGTALGSWAGTEWTYSLSEPLSEVTIVSSKQIRFSSLTITVATSGVSSSVKSPRLSLVETAEGYAVEMTCETEGAEIYYTTSEEGMPADPTDASTRYTAPVEVWMTTYFKAVAYLNGEASSVSTFTAEPPYVLENFMPLADFDGDAQIDVRGNITAVYQNGDNLWVADEYNNGMLMYGTSTQTLNNGDVIDGLKGKFTLYNGQPEITNYTLGAITSGTPVEPIDITLDELGSYILNRYVKLTGITIANESGYKYTMTDADGNTGIIYNRYGNASKYTEVTVPEGENFTVIGFVGKNYDDIQIIPVSVTGGEVMEQVSTPVITPENGILEAGAEIIISCDTEGATIYYTTDGSTPDAEATEYTGAISFSESMTLKAIAVKEGMLDSEVATASFTLYDPNGLQIYTFDFTDPAKYGISLPTAGSGTDLCEKGGSVTYTEGLVSLTFSCDESTQNVPRVWGKNNNGETVYDVRVYAGATVTFAATDENYKIQKIVFTQNTNATDWGASNTYLPDTFNKTDMIWNGEADAQPSESFTMVPGAKTFFATAQVYLSQPTVVETIDTESGASIVYYNLQGVRVANPENGLYIVVKGEKSSKIFFSK